MTALSEDLAFRGLIHQVSDDALLNRIDNDSLTLYAGFDPSADSLHVGSLLPLLNLRRFQLAGHRPIALAGGGTGLIGDPGGKTDERQLLDKESIEEYLAGIRPQLEKLLDFSPSAGSTQALMLNNADWLCAFSVTDFLRDIGKHFTVNQMVAKESVKSRLSRPDQGISFTEFSYMLLQACDFLQLYDDYGCRLQIGGSDQWGNITMGTDLIRKMRNESAWALTSPLVLKSDGTKFGKTEQGAVFLDPDKTSPFAFYQFFLRSEDSTVPAYLRYFTFFSHDEILDFDHKLATNPAAREGQRALARSVCTLVHGADVTSRMEMAAAALYSEDLKSLDETTLLMALEDAPTTTISRTTLDDGLDLVDLLVEVGLVKSKRAARDALGQGGVYVNNVSVDPEVATIGRDALIADRYVVVRRGKRDSHLLSFS